MQSLGRQVDLVRIPTGIWGKGGREERMYSTERGIEVGGREGGMEGGREGRKKRDETVRWKANSMLSNGAETDRARGKDVLGA